MLFADKTHYNSSITFLCNPSVFPGVPELDSVDAKGCHYKYKWETIAACPNQSEALDYNQSDCQVIHPWNKFFSLDAFRYDNFDDEISNFTPQNFKNSIQMFCRNFKNLNVGISVYKYNT